MARKIFGPRKQRTRQHVIADQSVNHVERFIIDEGHTAQRLEKDYGYDLLLSTYDEQGYVEPGLVCLQPALCAISSNMKSRFFAGFQGLAAFWAGLPNPPKGPLLLGPLIFSAVFGVRV